MFPDKVKRDLDILIDMDSGFPIVETPRLLNSVAEALLLLERYISRDHNLSSIGNSKPNIFWEVTNDKKEMDTKGPEERSLESYRQAPRLDQGR